MLYRNELFAEKCGTKMDKVAIKFQKTGTTIVGVVYKVRAYKKHTSSIKRLFYSCYYRTVLYWELIHELLEGPL